MDEITELLGVVQDDNLSQEDRAEAWGLCLETAAQLELEGHPLDSPLPAHPELEKAALAMLDPEELLDAADAVARLLESAGSCQGDLDELVLELEPLLLVRHRAFTRGYFAHSIPDALARAIGYFDALLRPLVWAMSFSNQMRSGHAELIAPTNRSRAWWWCEGLDVEWATVEQAFQTALLASRFPAFGRHLQAMCEPAHVLNELRSMPIGLTPTASMASM